MICACVSGSSITAMMLLRSPSLSLAKRMPLENAPPKQAIAAMPMGSPVRPSIAVSAMELRGDVQIIFRMPPSKKPITMGDCSVAAVMTAPI